MQTFLWVSFLLFLGALLTSTHPSKGKKSAFVIASIVFVYLILSAFYVISDYFTGEGVNDAVIYHLRYGLDGSGFGDYYLIILIAIALLCVSLMVSIVYYRLAHKAFYLGP